jgi:hypothetical protein
VRLEKEAKGEEQVSALLKQARSTAAERRPKR